VVEPPQQPGPDHELGRVPRAAHRRFVRVEGVCRVGEPGRTRLGQVKQEQVGVQVEIGMDLAGHLLAEPAGGPEQCRELALQGADQVVALPVALISIDCPRQLYGFRVGMLSVG
jgi:hypothetical protein